MFTLKSEILVSEVMIEINRIPIVEKKAIMKEAMDEMGKKRFGIACIINQDKNLLGILTDGDIRRKLMMVQKPLSAILIDDAMEYSIRAPSTIKPDESLIRAVELMEEKQIWDLPVVTKEGKLVGLLHLHQAVQILLGMKS
jgi:arabinose-5-phosphate isomerase